MFSARVDPSSPPRSSFWQGAASIGTGVTKIALNTPVHLTAALSDGYFLRSYSQIYQFFYTYKLSYERNALIGVNLFYDGPGTPVLFDGLTMNFALSMNILLMALKQKRVYDSDNGVTSTTREFDYKKNEWRTLPARVRPSDVIMLNRKCPLSEYFPETMLKKLRESPTAMKALAELVYFKLTHAYSGEPLEKPLLDQSDEPEYEKGSLFYTKLLELFENDEEAQTKADVIATRVRALGEFLCKFDLDPVFDHRKREKFEIQIQRDELIKRTEQLIGDLVYRARRHDVNKTNGWRFTAKRPEAEVQQHLPEKPRSWINRFWKGGLTRKKRRRRRTTVKKKNTRRRLFASKLLG